MGNADHKYKVIEDWGKLPEGISYGYTHGVVADRSDNIYIFNMSRNAVIVFDSEGNYIRSFGEQFVNGAHGFLLNEENSEEFLYATDYIRGLVVKMTLEGKELLTIGTPDLPKVYDETKKYLPTDIAVSPNGDIYTADGYGQSYIHQYDSKGQYIRSWGGYGSEPGQFIQPHGISVDTRRDEPEIYVADRGNNRIQVFSLDGQYKRLIKGNMNLPCSFFFHNNEMYVPDLYSRVSIFDENDELITHLGEDPDAIKQHGWPNLPESYFKPDKFSSPHGVCVDSNDSVYVVEWTEMGRVTKLCRIY